ncbi:MAG: hypothetical protein QOD77_551 [Thermoplasmata archaeon]|jgi:hypothetical protein|nr:hypothetical protein [Thermoplasmata archaeon]
MAGGVLKTFGGIFLVLGCVLVLGGLAAAATGYVQESDNRDKGPFYDGQEGDINQQMVLYGLIGAGAGLLLAIVAAVLLAGGGARGRRALERSIAARGAPAETATGAAPARTASRKAVVPPPPPPSKNGKGAIIAVVAMVALFGVVALLVAGGFKDIVAPGSSRDADTPAETYRASFNGTLAGTAFGIGFLPASDRLGEFVAPQDSAQCTLTLGWTPAPGGAETLQLWLGRDGKEIANATGGPDLQLQAAVLPGLHDWQVGPGSGDLVAQQEFTLLVVCTGEA